MSQRSGQCTEYFQAKRTEYKTELFYLISLVKSKSVTEMIYDIFELQFIYIFSIIGHLTWRSYHLEHCFDN